MSIHLPLFKSSFNSVIEAPIFLTTEKNAVSSANNLRLNVKFSDKSDLYILWVMEVFWFMHDSPVLKPDWLGKIQVILDEKLKYWGVYYELYCRLVIEVLVDSFLVATCNFLMDRTFASFHSPWKQHFSRHSWALSESKFCKKILISYSLNIIFDKDLSVLGFRRDGISLPLSIIEHCLAKKELNIFFFEIDKNTIFVKNWWNTYFFMERL